MNIFIGTFEIARITSGLANGFKKLGHNVTTLVKERHPYFSYEYDYVVERPLAKKKFLNTLKSKPLKQIRDYFDYRLQNEKIRRIFPSLLQNHDLFIFIWTSLLLGNKDYEILKKNGKKIATLFVGTDIRHISAFKQEFQGDQSSWEKDFFHEDLNEKLSLLRYAEYFSDLIYSVPDQSGLAIKPYDHLHIPLFIKNVRFNIPQNKKLKIVHCPSRRGLKGTEQIIATMEKLRNEGFDFDFTIIENLTNDKIIHELEESDILVDELNLHGPGTLGLEAMAAGCAVATNYLDSYLNIFSPPACKINTVTIYEQLKKLLRDTGYRTALAYKGREFVEKHNNPEIIAQRILTKLHSQAEQKEIKYDYYPSFFLKNYSLPENVSIDTNISGLTKNIILKYGIHPDVNIVSAMKRKIIPYFTEDEIKATKKWNIPSNYILKMRREIPISSPSLGQEEWDALRESIFSGWVAQGPKVKEFEKKFAERHQVKHAIAVTSATNALHLSLLALGIGPGDEVLVPAFSWVATANVVLFCGATPILIDIDIKSFNISPKEISKHITPKTRAIIPVHSFGLCADMDEIKNAAPNLFVIEDAACAAGSAYKGRTAGSMGDIGCFSFHPRKSITTGEGGMITTNDDKLAEIVISLRNHGAVPVKENKPYIIHDCDKVGYNYRMTDIQAAIGIVQLKKLDKFISEKQKWAEYYSEELKKINWICVPTGTQPYSHTWQSYVIMINKNLSPCSRNQIMDFLLNKGIQTRPGTMAIHTLSFYSQKYSLKPVDYPNALHASLYSIAIPLHNKMTSEDYKYVVECLQSIK